MTISEREWQDKVVQYAKWMGWWVYHPWSSRNSERGWPDCTFIRGNELIFAEMKSETGRVRPEQEQVLDMLRRTGAEVHVWRPSEWRFVEQRLA